MRARTLLFCASALILGACANTATYSHRDPDPGEPSLEGRVAGTGTGIDPNCDSCGVVENIERVYRNSQSARADDVLGGVVGQSIGTQRTAGGEIRTGTLGSSNPSRGGSRPVYQVAVRLDDGRRIMVSQRDLGGIREGAYVIVSDGRARIR